jgi:hypothetical protein
VFQERAVASSPYQRSIIIIFLSTSSACHHFAELYTLHSWPIPVELTNLASTRKFLCYHSLFRQKLALVLLANSSKTTPSLEILLITLVAMGFLRIIPMA